MAIVYNWVVSSMEEYPITNDNLKDVVFKIHWRRNATEVINDIIYFAETFDVVLIPEPTPEVFTPYSDLTFEKVCEWLELNLDWQDIDTKLSENIQQQINPKIISLPLPWIS